MKQDRKPYKQLREKHGLKRYSTMDQFVRFANLYKREVDGAGVIYVKVGGTQLREDALPSLAWVDEQDTGSYGPEYELPGEEEPLEYHQEKLEARLLAELADPKKIKLSGAPKYRLDPRRRLLNDIDDRFRQKFPKGIAVGPHVWDEFPNELLTYRAYISTVEVLAQIAEKFRDWRPGQFCLITLPARAAAPFVANYAEGPTDMWGDLLDRGEPRSSILKAFPDLIWDGLRTALTDGKLEAHRLKRCPVCANFFIAWRADKQACSPPCLENYRVKKHRAKRPDYEENRKWAEHRRREFERKAQPLIPR